MADTTIAAPPARPAGRSCVAANILPWVQLVLLSVVAPIVIYDMMTARGVGEVPALVLSGIGPALDIVITMVWRRRIDEFSVIVLGFLAIGVVAGLLFDDPRVLLLKESVITGLLGLLMLGSLLASKPLMFYFGRRFATGGDPARVRWWNGLWADPGFRRTERVLTAVWGVVLLAEALVRSALTFVLPVATMVVINNVAPLVVLVGLVLFTIVYARRAQARGARHGVHVPEMPEPGAALVAPADTSEQPEQPGQEPA